MRVQSSKSCNSWLKFHIKTYLTLPFVRLVKSCQAFGAKYTGLDAILTMVGLGFMLILYATIAILDSISTAVFLGYARRLWLVSAMFFMMWALYRMS